MSELLRWFLRQLFQNEGVKASLFETGQTGPPPGVGTAEEREAGMIWGYYRTLRDNPATLPELTDTWGLSDEGRRAVRLLYRAVEQNRGAPWLGQEIGGYRVLYRIGRGGMSEVYAVCQVSRVRQEPEAMKLVRQDPERSTYYEELRARLHREAQTMLAISSDRPETRGNPHAVVRFHYADEDRANCQLYIVTELVHGRSLWQLTTDPEVGGGLPADEALALVTEICRGVVAIHHCGMIHRDLSASNVMVLEDGRVKIIDLGLARPIQPPGRGFETRVTGRQWGTNWFASPEQRDLLGEVDQRTDIYALGKLLYFLIQFQRAWEDPERPPDYHLPPAEDAAWQGMPPALAEVIRKAAHRTREERYESAEQLLAALVQLGGDRVRPARCLDRVRHLLRQEDREVNIWVGADLAPRPSAVPVPPALQPAPASAAVTPAPLPAAEVIQLPPAPEPKTLPPIDPVPATPRWGWIAAGGTAAGGLVLLVVLALVFGLGWGAREPGNGHEDSPVTFQGYFNFFVTERGGRRFPQKRSLGGPDVLALRATDYGYFEAQLEKGPDAYFYLIQIDSKGQAHLQYPPGWTWEALPAREVKRKTLRIPEESPQDIPLAATPAGLEAFLWLVRAKPLTRQDNEALRQLLTGTGFKWGEPRELQDGVVILVNGEVTEHRGAMLLERARVPDHPVDQTRHVMEQLKNRRLASFSRAACYTFTGREPGAANLASALGQGGGLPALWQPGWVAETTHDPRGGRP